jgi:DNA-directed RNA polymerase specialized sigma24 family protein
MSTLDLRTAEFKQLLNICVNPGHRLFQKAWHEFENRYRTIILGRIRNYLIRWNTSNNLDVVHDISSSVTLRLLNNDFRALKKFRERDNEAKFISFLNVICKHSAYSYMMGFIKINKMLKENDELNLSRFISDHPDVAEDIQDFVVNLLRGSLSETQKSAYHRERDILIYILRNIAGFKAKEVAQIPLLKISQGNVDNVVNRLSKLILNHT